MQDIVEIVDDNAQYIKVLQKKKEQCEATISHYRYKWWGWLLAIIVGGVFGYFVSTALWYESHLFSSAADTFANHVFSIFLGSSLCCLLYASILGIPYSMLSSTIRNLEIRLIHFGVEELKEKIDENFFTHLIKINFKYIDQYYLQTQGQADKSFKLACIASLFGLIIIVLGIIMMFLNKTTPAYVTTSAGVISEFIAAVFFYLYNRTVTKMSQYHHKLVLTQNISLALKITDEMDPQTKNRALDMIVDRLTTDINKSLIAKDE